MIMIYIIYDFLFIYSMFLFCCQAVGVEVERLVIGAGSEDRVTRALDMAEKEEAWLILDGVHLASSQLSRSLRVALTRVAYSRGKHILLEQSLATVLMTRPCHTKHDSRISTMFKNLI